REKREVVPLLVLQFYIALRCVIGAVGGIHVTGYMGSEVTVSCSYGQGYESYEKYLCKNNCGNGDVLIKTSESRKNKYVIHDDKTARIFTTTIFDLHSVDAGKYWCGVSKFGKDIYTEVEKTQETLNKEQRTTTKINQNPTRARHQEEGGQDNCQVPGAEGTSRPVKGGKIQSDPVVIVQQLQAQLNKGSLRFIC
uniref:Immunoglobulin V-set domain-containing protein n=1 Tax=Neolamprologus brichardi TaxID=32507 RepID=A0A3Q4NBH4_NEOBR